MITTTLDSICKGVLLRRRIGVAYYLDVLLAAVYCLREITIDDGLDVLNHKRLPVNILNIIEGIPEGAADVASVSIPVGQGLFPLILDKSLNPLHTLDGNFIEESFGRSNSKHTYNVLKEHNCIYLNESICVDYAIVSFIGDGRSSDAATHVDVNAEATIEACINWQLAENSSSYGMGEKERLRQLYISERKILRARNAHWDLNAVRLASVQVGRRRREYIGEITNSRTLPASSINIIPSTIDSKIVTLAAGATQYVLTHHTPIDLIIFEEPDATTVVTVSVGETNGGTEITEAFEYTGIGRFQTTLYYYNDTTIHFTGVTANTVIKLYKR